MRSYNLKNKDCIAYSENFSEYSDAVSALAVTIIVLCVLYLLLVTVLMMSMVGFKDEKKRKIKICQKLININRVLLLLLSLIILGFIESEYQDISTIMDQNCFEKDFDVAFKKDFDIVASDRDSIFDILILYAIIIFGICVE